jgi:transposase
MAKPKSFRPWNPFQTFLMPPSPKDWLPADHLVFFLLDLPNEMDFEAIVGPCRFKDARGEKGFNPLMMTLLLLYAYCVGIASSRKIERACYEDAAFRVLTGNQQPDHSRISEFRRRNLKALEALFVEVLKLCQKAGMVSLGHVALDGTKVEANASKHKAMSHERMLKAEQELEKEVKALLRKAEILDAQEDKKYGKGKRADGLPEELLRRTTRLEKIRQARKELEAEATACHARRRQEQAERAMQAVEEAAPERKDHQQRQADRAAEKAEAARNLAIEAAEVAGVEAPDLEPRAADAMPLRGLPTNAAGVPDAKAQRNFTDPDSHIMKRDNTFIQGYNCQAAVDGDHQIIVAIGVSNQPPDVEHHAPMLERILANTGAMPTIVTEDAGYWSEDNVDACEAMGIDPYIATGRLKHGQQPPPSRGPIPRNLDAKGLMGRKLRSKKGKETYARRKTIVEPVFGQMKECRGLRRFQLRSLEKVNGEWALWSMTHNLNKLFRYGKAQAALATG